MALRIKMGDVQMKEGLLSIRATNTKSKKNRTIQFNEALRKALEEILAALPDDTEWLFPSARRGEVDSPAATLRASF